mmetsp:Transcript_133385/g.231705  ORF Transcript_133385/g.231705 Transcript_133385/m.231705 type:complete len:296 (+) Transcript_133385:153-1040(+)
MVLLLFKLRLHPVFCFFGCLDFIFRFRALQLCIAKYCCSSGIDAFNLFDKLIPCFEDGLHLIIGILAGINRASIQAQIPFDFLHADQEIFGPVVINIFKSLDFVQQAPGKEDHRLCVLQSVPIGAGPAHWTRCSVGTRITFSSWLPRRSYYSFRTRHWSTRRTRRSWRSHFALEPFDSIDARQARRPRHREWRWAGWTWWSRSIQVFLESVELSDDVSPLGMQQLLRGCAMTMQIGIYLFLKCSELLHDVRLRGMRSALLYGGIITGTLHISAIFSGHVPLDFSTSKSCLSRRQV